MLELEPVMTYSLEVRGPLESKDDSEAAPHLQYWEMAKARLHGPTIEATSTMPGIDWFTPYPNGYGRPHVRIPFQTNDGAVILLEYRGIVQATDAFLEAVKKDTSTRWEDQYMRMSLYFDTSSKQYAWLTQSLFVAR